MIFKMHTDRHIEGHASLSTWASDLVQDALGHYGAQTTRVDAHLSDENGDKGGADDKRCVMEAHVEHHQPLVVTHHAPSMHLAITGAADKLSRLLESTFERTARKQVQAPAPD